MVSLSHVHPTVVPDKHTIYPETKAVIKFGDLPEIWPNALLVEFKFGGLPEWVLITLTFGAA